MNEPETNPETGTKPLDLSSMSDVKDIVEILLNKKYVEMATDLDSDEILPLSILEAISDNMVPSADGLEKMESPIIKNFIWKFKRNRISRKRKSRSEVIEGLLGGRTRIEDIQGLGARLGSKIRGEM